MPELGLETIFKLREMSEQDLDAAEDKLYKASAPITVIKRYDSGVFEVGIVLSGEKLYEVIRFGDFVFCPCKDFEYSGTACKHCPLLMPLVCRKCRERPVKQRGRKCSRCEHEESPYMRQKVEGKRELVGSIPV